MREKVYFALAHLLNMNPLSKNILNHNYTFEMSKEIDKELDGPIIKVIGVGGGGGNAVAHMAVKGIKDVEFVVCNTDRQALMKSPIEHKIQLGAERLKGLGAGTDAIEGQKAAEESIEYLRRLMQPPTKMVFITAGMGGGTGTGASPVIAQVAKEAGMLTVAVVTAPRNGEGKLKKQQAIDGINLLKQHCDTVLVILNDKLAELHGKLPRTQADQYADNVLANAVKSIAEIITIEGKVNSDFMDVKRILEKAGTSVMASATATGENRATFAIEEALNSPLLNNRDIKGAKRILVTLTSSYAHEVTYDEETEISELIDNKVGDETDITKIGIIYDDSLGETLQVTVIAAGFEDSHLPFTLEGAYGKGVASPIIQTKPIEPEPVMASVTREEELEESYTTSGPVRIIVEQKSAVIDLKTTKNDVPKETTPSKEDAARLKKLRSEIEAGNYTEATLNNRPAYERQDVVFYSKPNLPKEQFVRILLDKSKR